MLVSPLVQTADNPRAGARGSSTRSLNICARQERTGRRGTLSLQGATHRALSTRAPVPILMRRAAATADLMEAVRMRTGPGLGGKPRTCKEALPSGLGGA